MLALAQEAAAPAGENPYGLIPALKQGGLIAQSVFGLLVIMMFVSFYTIFTKFFEQRTILNEGRIVQRQFWKANSLEEGRAKLPKDSAYRQIVDDGLAAAEHHEGALTDKIDQHEWITTSLTRSTTAIGARLQSGLSFLASVGSTAPFIGLFGTVVGIYRALINIGLAGQASIDKVAGPVGESLIMTALGIAVAVPAVLGYNWLIRRNKRVQEQLNDFASDLHSMLVSGARVGGSPTGTMTPHAAAAE
ncbi:MAG: MotA/TolQ/ExbB proton channel family protein [Sphingomonadaceae bacterium]|nr:MotA/TolQ/ExbB proton channel family protein [Sphingomonadaceae bacterium]